MDTVDLNPKKNLSGMGIDLDDVESIDRQRILVVDDDPDTVFLLKQILRVGGFDVMGASSGHDALKKMTKEEPDLVLLDLMMPDMDGWETFSNVRKMTEVPIIVVSAMSTKDDIVDGLRRGIDDYITKPFYNPEIIERVKTVLRRAGKHPELSRLVFPQVKLILDLKTQEVLLDGQEIRMTQKEFALLSLLAKNTPAIVSYEFIADTLWGHGANNVRKRTNYLAYLLRRKFEKVAPDIKLIINVDRAGYRLNTSM